ncbi:MAG: transcriptional regulator [Candidatus Altiarchaeales archaeon IMC4]|nr:MAG: transcriptional regulator [Candidatus Altiarchaeales archaeon IMC4]
MKPKTNLKETETIELKKSTSELKEAIVSIASILNKHQKGELYFGVKGNGEVVGQEIGEKTLRDISKSISDHIEPKIFPEVVEKELGGKKCISVEFEGVLRPYFAYGRAYVRIGDEDRQMSAKELERLILEKNRTFWEKEFSDRKLEDVNEGAVKEFMEKANRAKRINFKFSGVEPTLRKLNLIKDGKLLNAAEVLFCDDNPFEVQAAVFAGTDKLTFLDIRQFNGNLFSLLEQSKTYLKERINWRAELGFEGRKEIPEIPIRAITEALVNSLCHRDYANPNTNKIAVFKDRVEIYNPGQFPEGYEPDDFIKGEEDESILRNPLIANALYLSDDIEKWASGLKRISDACEEEGVRFEFKKRKSGFVIVFYRSEQKTSGKTTPQTTPQTTPKTDELLLMLIKKNPRTTKEWLAGELGITVDGVKYHLKKLKGEGVVSWRGSSKAGHWEIKEKGANGK